MDKVFYRLGGDINIVTLLRALSPEASMQIAPQLRVDDGLTLHPTIGDNTCTRWYGTHLS